MTYKCVLSKFEMKKLENKKKKTQKKNQNNSAQPIIKKWMISVDLLLHTHGIRAVDNLDRTGVNYKSVIAEIKNNTIKRKNLIICGIFSRNPINQKEIV